MVGWLDGFIINPAFLQNEFLINLLLFCTNAKKMGALKKGHPIKIELV